MVFDVAELRLTGIDDHNVKAVQDYEQYLIQNLPQSEVIRDLFIDVDIQPLLSDLYFFTDHFMVEVPDFVTYYDGRFHTKKMNFTIHPLKNAVTFLSQKISNSTDSCPRTVEVSFGLRSSATFSFMEMKENSLKLEYISKTYLIPNLSII